MVETGSWGRRARAWAAAAVVALGWSTQAEAVIVVGTWDPPYGTGLPGYGWRGQATLDVPVVPPNGSAAATVVTAQVEFYDLADPLTTVETLDFGAVLGPVPATVYSVLGTVVGFETDDPLATPAGREARSVISTFFGGLYFALDFDFVDPQTLAVLYLTADPSVEYDPQIKGFGFVNETPAVVEVSTLPDPAPVAAPSTSLLAALGLLMLASRRRRPRGPGGD